MDLNKKPIWKGGGVETPAYKPKNIELEDTWTAYNVWGIPQLHVLNIYMDWIRIIFMWSKFYIS